MDWLSPRLMAIARRVPPGCCVVDIGTDHAMLAVYLEKTRSTRKVVATDKSEDSLHKARANAVRYGVAFDVRQGDGLEPVSYDELDVAVIAGVGSQTIAEILSSSRRKVRALSRIVVQPMKDEQQLRRWVHESALRIVHEDLVIDAGRVYDIMTFEGCAQFEPAEWNTQHVSAEYEVSEQLLRNDAGLLLRYFERRRKIRLGLSGDLREVSQEISDEHLRAVHLLDEIIEEIREKRCSD